MKIMIQHSSMQPIYEQIVEQIKQQVMHGELEKGTMLPSVRSLAKDLKISALTVKKAYDFLEEEGIVVTVHGKGSYIAEVSNSLFLEESRREVEEALDEAVGKGRSCGMSDEELREVFALVLEDRG